MKFFALLLTLASCNKKPFIRTYSQNEKMYLESLSLEEGAYMDGCLKYSSREVYDCIKYMKDDFRGYEKNTNGGSSILKTAAGTALGYGAAKIILGK
jgi:hypothetical protein